MKIKKETLYKITASLLLALPLISLAQILPTTAPATVNDIKEVVRGIFKLIGIVAGLVALAYFAIGVFMFVTSKGEPRTLSEAKVNIIWAVLAVLIAAALFNMSTILNYFGVIF